MEAEYPVKKYFRTVAARFLDCLIQSIPIGMASSLEWRIQKVLGKGIGSSSLKDEIRTLDIFIKQLKLKEVILFDIGANVGQFGLEFKLRFPESKLHSFEPSAIAFKELATTASKYENWSCYNLGFASQEKQAKLYATSAGSASATLLEQEGAFGKNLKLEFEIVEIKRLDSFLEANLHMFPNVVKMDIEGFELDCLHGSSESISKFQIIQFEFGEINIDSRTYFRDYWNFFGNLGFRLFRITRGDPIEVREYNESLETFAVTNYLAVRPLEKA